MFENLTDRLSGTLKRLSGRGQITEANIQDTVQEVRKALLEADVALPVVKAFIEQVKTEAVGARVVDSLNPGQVFIKIVHQSLTQLMGQANDRLNLSCAPPAVILMAGLQGAGKTTSVAKLAKWLMATQKKSVLVASADVYRPAAIAQLQTLAAQVGCEFFPSEATQKPVDIASQALASARQSLVDVVILDTAGRLHVDEDMMHEIQQIHATVNPVETLFVVDAMTGQDAANTAKAFDEALALTGVVLSKADGDARGGAALSVRHITGKPIKFLGVAEKLDGLEAFHPERMASRILGMGDVLSLVEEAERNLDKKQADKFANKIKKGKGFDFEDMLAQFQQLKRMGGMASLMDKLPGMGQFAKLAETAQSEDMFKHMEALILSMTPQERRFPDVINASRKKRIAKGAGQDIPEMNRLIKQHKQMQKMLKKFGKKGGAKNMQRQMESFLSQGPGGLPPGLG